MKKSLLRFSGFLLILSLCFTFNCAQQGEKVNVEADIAAVKEIGNQYASSINAGDLDLFISMWTDDGVQMPPDVPAVIGKEQIQAKMKPTFDQFIMEISISTEEVGIGGDWAFARCTYTLSLTPKAGGETTMIDGKDLHILKRQTDGSWKIAIDCFNNNAPPEQE